MIIEYIRYRIPTDLADRFIVAYQQGLAPLKRSPYFRQFEFARCVEDTESFIVRIEWTSQADHLKKFRASDEFRAFFVLVKPYVSHIEEMYHYEQLFTDVAVD